ncbi:MAG: PEGA domain-containing protein [Planctomycetaceae bacterium]
MRRVCLLLLLATTACVERRLHIRTEPEGARILVNGRDVGRSPVAWRFDHYGTVLVEAELEGYEPAQRTVALRTPWYQRPVLDFFSELVLPARIRDDHAVVFPLARRRPVTEADRPAIAKRVEELAERAAKRRKEAGEP